jgi:ATP-binding cassette subfamily B protein
VALHRRLLLLLRHSTVMTVTHRLTTIADYDRVLVVGHGKILEDGPPHELLKKPVGFFSSLWRASGDS